MFDSAYQSEENLPKEADYFKDTYIDFQLQFPQNKPQENSGKHLTLSTSQKIINAYTNRHHCGCIMEEFNTVDISSNTQNGALQKPLIGGECHIHKSSIISQLDWLQEPIYKPPPQILPLNSPQDDMCSDHEENEEPFTPLIPEIYEVNSQTYISFLLDNLRGYSNDISLVEFYTLLCSFGTPDSGFFKQTTGVERDVSSETATKKEGFAKISFMLETFRSSCNGIRSNLPGFINPPQLSFVRFEEILKNFLAIKILLDSIEVTQQSLSTSNILPRKTVYESYCRISQQLIKQYQKDSKLSKKHMNSFVGIAHFGKLMKLVFPNLKAKCIGRRGQSRNHYLGIIWNDPIPVVEETRNSETHEKNLDILGNNVINMNYGLGLHGEKSSVLIKPKITQKRNNHNLSPDHPKPASFYSFINPSSKFPEIEFSPRIWTFSPRKIPEQSIWARNIISKSASALKRYKIYMEGIIQNLHIEMFRPEGSVFFLTYFVPQLNLLINGNSDEKGYMHLYLIILQLIFPLILSSDEEVSLEGKETLRKNLLMFINHLTETVPNLPDREWGHILNFSNIIRRMIHFNELTSCQIETGLIEGITEVIASDVKRQFGFEYDFCEPPSSENIILRAVIMASKAFESTLVDIDSQHYMTGDIDFILKVVNSFANFTIAGTEGMLNIPNSMSNQALERTTFDLPFQIFLVSVQCFHDICLTDPYVLKLPIKVIDSISLSIHNEMHNVSFKKFGIREQEISKNTFKTWWIYSTLAQEYSQIFSEIVA